MDGMQPDPQRLSLAQLAERCAGETRRFYNNEPSDPAYCYELLRRAFVGGDQLAWDLVYQQYKAQIRRWVLHHPQFAATGEEAEDICHSTFTRLFRVVTPEKFAQFPNLATLLRYMQMTVNSVIMDLVRKRPSRELVDVDDDTTEPLLAPAGDLSPLEKQELWQLILSKLKTDGEVVLVRASFVWDMKPAEIYQTYPHLFAGVDDIYRLKQNILDRLSRVSELK